MMPTAETLTLWVHVAAGFVALFGGLGALASRKGGRRHRRFGRAYVYAMAVVSGSALVLFGFEQSTDRQFLSLVAIFSFYFAYSGYRVLSRKRPTDDPAAVDWTALGLFGVASVGLVVLGALQYVAGASLAVVVLVFGGIGVAFTASDFRTFRADPEPGGWVTEHVVRMGAGYIATVTAFATVNFTFLPEIARWLGPTVVGSAIIVYYTREYEVSSSPG